jgi:ureidoglycolate lyase
MVMRVTAVPVTHQSFSPYGQLIEAPSKPGRKPFTEGLSHDEREFVLSATRSQPVELPLLANQLERHSYSSQTFVPLDVSRWLVIVSTTLAMADVRAFVVGSGVGVTIGRGIWHHELTVLDRAASFAVAMWKDGVTDDDFVDVEPFEVHL